jgi:hypothetical protein
MKSELDKEIEKLFSASEKSQRFTLRQFLHARAAKCARGLD